MIKLSVALSTFVLALALPVAYAFASKPSSKTIAAMLLHQMNSGPDGRVTHRVTCLRTSKAGKSFNCSLESVALTRLGANVAVVDGGLQTTWKPLEG
jgi:hypothetical protein